MASEGARPPSKASACLVNALTLKAGPLGLCKDACARRDNSSIGADVCNAVNSPFMPLPWDDCIATGQMLTGP